jgi:alpha-ketoglutaric semialdehyde dehydrogenase
MSLHGLSLLAGVPGKTGGKKFNAVNPATNERLEPAFHEASEAEVAGALDASAAAFNTYRACSGAERAKLLETIATEIEALGDALLQRANAETGLPLARLTG